MIKYKLIKLLSGTLLFTLALTGCAGRPSNNTPTPNQTKAQDTTEQSVQAPAPKPEPVQAKLTYYYTANESGSVSKIDSGTNQVVDTIKVDGEPHNIQVSPDGKIVALTSPVKMTEEQEKDENMEMSMGMKGSVLFYDADAETLINKVEVGEHPAHVVFTGDGKYALVTDGNENNVSIIDTATYKITGTVAVGKGPHGFRISKDSQFAYVANMDEDTVSIVDIANKKEVKKIKVGKAPVTTGITNDGKILLVPINSENVLAIVDLGTDNVQKIPVGVGPAQVYIQPDEKFAFVANQGTKENPSNTVSKIDMASQKVIATIQTGKGSHGLVVSPDNKFVYVTNMYENTVSVIDNTTDKVVDTVQVDAEPNGISFGY